MTPDIGPQGPTFWSGYSHGDALTVFILACPQVCKVQSPKSQEGGVSGSGVLNGLGALGIGGAGR